MGWSQGNDVYIGRAYKTDISDLDIYVKGQHVQWGSHPTPGYNPSESCIHMPKVMCAGMSTAELLYHIAIKNDWIIAKTRAILENILLTKEARTKQYIPYRSIYIKFKNKQN